MGAHIPITYIAFHQLMGETSCSRKGQELWVLPGPGPDTSRTSEKWQSVAERDVQSNLEQMEKAKLHMHLVKTNREGKSGRNEVWVFDHRYLLMRTKGQGRRYTQWSEYRYPPIIDFLQNEMEGKCVKVSQRPTTIHCHPLENQKGHFLPYFPPSPSSSLSLGRKWHPKFTGWETLRPDLSGRMVNWQELLIMSSKVMALVSALWHSV